MSWFCDTRVIYGIDGINCIELLLLALTNVVRSAKCVGHA